MTRRQKEFVEAYMIDLNGTEAVIRAGYNAKDRAGAGAIAYKLLQTIEIKDEINARLLERHRRNALTVEKIEMMLRALAEVELLDLYDEQGHVKPLQDMPPDARAAIKSIKRKTREHAIDGVFSDEVELELWDRKSALELLGKHFKMFTDKLDLGGQLDARVTFTINGVAK